MSPLCPKIYEEPKGVLGGGEVLLYFFKWHQEFKLSLRIS